VETRADQIDCPDFVAYSPQLYKTHQYGAINESSAQRLKDFEFLLIDFVEKNAYNPQFSRNGARDFLI